MGGGEGWMLGDWEMGAVKGWFGVVWFGLGDKEKGERERGVSAVSCRSCRGGLLAVGVDVVVALIC